MRGPMSVHNKEKYPWLQEKIFIKQAIEQNKTVIGICPNAQLIAGVPDAAVYPNAYKEIGWFTVMQTIQSKDNFLLKDIEYSFTVFHWHGDTFHLPGGAMHLLQSEACAYQAFLYKNNAPGIQAHFEATEETLSEMICHGRHELVPHRYVQTKEHMLAQQPLMAQNNQRLYEVLKKLEERQYQTFR